MSRTKYSVSIPWKNVASGSRSSGCQSSDEAILGVVKTVFESPHITEFQVKLSGIVPQGGAAGIDIYIGRAFGPEIELIGGVPAGASGSPVYSGGRLIGAISYLFQPDATLIGVTPIDSMLALKSEPNETPIGIDQVSNRRHRWKNHTADHVSDPGCTAHGAPFMLPTVGGFWFDRSLRRVEKVLARRLCPTPKVHKKSFGRLSLQAGAPFGVGLLAGDLRLGFIGTVTQVTGDQVFALGHPALFAGPTRLPLTEAIIFETARGQSPRKVGDLGKVVGTVTQDRAAGVYGRIGMVPATVRLDLRVSDKDRNVTQHIYADAADVAALLPTLVGSATHEVFLRAMNRVGQGTAKWLWHVGLRGNEQPIVEQEVLFDPFDIGGAVAQSAEQLVSNLIDRGVLIEWIGLKASVTAARLKESYAQGALDDPDESNEKIGPDGLGATSL